MLTATKIYSMETLNKKYFFYKVVKHNNDTFNNATDITAFFKQRITVGECIIYHWVISEVGLSDLYVFEAHQ